MIAVVQRVRRAWVEVSGDRVGEIGVGLLVFVGVLAGDDEEDASWLARKLLGLRIFPDAEGKMNLDTAAVGGGFLLIPNFTLGADLRKGNRPSFNLAAPPEQAEALFDRLADLMKEAGARVETGRFGAMMEIGAEMFGPVTLVVDTAVRHRPRRA